MRHDYECVNSDSFKHNQHFGKGEWLTILALFAVIILGTLLIK